MRRLTIGLITCLALADAAGAVWLWAEWQARDQRRLLTQAAAQPCRPEAGAGPASRCN